MAIKICKKRGIRYYSDPEKSIGELPSVTSILNLLPKPRCQKWAIKQTIDFLIKQKNLTPEITSRAYGYHESYLNLLADKGTAKHKLAEDYLLKKPVTKDKWLDRFIGWEKENDFKIIDTEKSILSSELGVAGTLDLVGTVHGELMIVDIKTSSAIRFTHKVQVCAYKLLLGCIDYKIGILNIPRSGSKVTWYILTESEEEAYTQIFLDALKLFNQLNFIGELEF